MAFKLGASIGIKALMDTSSVERGAAKISGMFDSIARKSKETNVFLSTTSRILGDLIKAGAAFGTAFVGAITGVVAASPHFKAFLGSLKGPWMKLTKFFGETFSPVLKLIANKFKEFVGIVTGNEKVKNFFDKWVTKISEFVKTISQDDMTSFIEKLLDLADKGAEFTLNVGGKLHDILFGDEETKGILKALLDLPGTVTKTLGINTTINEPEGIIAKSILALAAFKFGGPLLGGLVTSAIIGQGMQSAVGTPGTPGYKSREDVGNIGELGRILDNIVTLVTGRDKPLHPGFGSVEGEKYNKNTGTFTVILENRTGTQMNASSYDPTIGVTLV